MSLDLEPARQGTLRRLSAAYAEGLLTPATLEARISEALVAEEPHALWACEWDLPGPAARWRRRVRRGAPPLALIVEADGTFARVELGPPPAAVVIGRDPACGVRVANTSVSRRHAIVSRRGGACRIRDLGSSNGTILNGRAIEVGELGRGDRLALGEVLIRVI